MINKDKKTITRSASWRFLALKNKRKGGLLKIFQYKILIIFKSIYIGISVYSAKTWAGNFPSCPPTIDALCKIIHTSRKTP